jgi:predicted DNA-binding protein with PD1-like motif
MKLYSLRLKPGQDLRKELINYASKNDIRAGSIVTCVGALKYFTLRMAGATPENQDIRSYSETAEIVSLVGTLSTDDCHLHISLSTKDGTVIGGHLKEGSLVDLTAEITILDDEAKEFSREPDEETGFTELVIKDRKL